jgi:hypothetical protein
VIASPQPVFFASRKKSSSEKEFPEKFARLRL